MQVFSRFNILTYLFCLDLVMKQLKMQSEEKENEDTESEEATDIATQLKELLPKVKDLVLNARKNPSASPAQEGDWSLKDWLGF